MESQPQNPEFRINPENFHPWNCRNKISMVMLMYRQMSKPPDSNLFAHV